ncbi:MAG: serine/threonine protein kinase [Alistipes sp.]|nr:serine/threonine protein kinase [Alistipes sp.]
MRDYNSSSSASGYIIDSFEGISSSFTDISVISESQYNVVAKAKRYGRWWMLKGLQRDAAGEEAFRQRLRKEFELLAELQHPSVITVAGFEQVEGLGMCIVAEYADGLTLGEWLVKGRSTRVQRRAVADKIMEAVAYIHSKGIVHRDLKPSNIIVTQNGAGIRIIDFGLADSDNYAVLKQPAGTPDYMSPEQKETAEADVRNDIYSLGVVFSQMDLGRRRIIRRCLLPADRRWQSVAELQEAFGRDRGRGMRLFAAMVAVMTIALVIIMLWKHSPSEPSQTDMRNIRVSEAVESGTAQADKLVEELELAHYADTMSKTGYIGKEYSPSEPSQTDMRNIRISEAIESGTAQLDKLFEELGLAHYADTMRQTGYLGKEYYERLNTFTDYPGVFVEEHCSSFADRERSEIVNALYNHATTIIEPHNRELQEIYKIRYETTAVQ